MVCRQVMLDPNGQMVDFLLCAQLSGPRQRTRMEHTVFTDPKKVPTNPLHQFLEPKAALYASLSWSTFSWNSGCCTSCRHGVMSYHSAVDLCSLDTVRLRPAHRARTRRVSGTSS